MFDAYVLVNFGGPRNQDEVYPFLKALLCDQDVIQTGFIKPFHDLLFSYIAKKRSKTVKEDYQEIGGASPIFFDTEKLAVELEKEFERPFICFHRYLPATHQEFFQKINQFKDKKILCIPMFPQFSFATTGSCARFFEQNLCGRLLENIQWIPSYATHSAFINAYSAQIKKVCLDNQLSLDQVCLFTSFHGVPRKFICFNDPYENHCQASFNALKAQFPESEHILAYQSKFGKGEWLRPYTIDLVENEPIWDASKHVLFVPLSFTSDHIETLFEVQEQYIEPLLKKGLKALRVPSLQGQSHWLYEIIKDHMPYLSTSMLVRREKKGCCQRSTNCCRCKKVNQKKKSENVSCCSS